MIVNVEYQDKQLEVVAEYILKNNKYVKYWAARGVKSSLDVETHIINTLKSWVLESAKIIRNYELNGIPYTLPYTDARSTGGYCLVYSIEEINKIEIFASADILVDLLITSGKYVTQFVAEID